jgi:predicted transcriptional regulator
MNSGTSQHLSPAEWQVMAAVWKLGEANALQVSKWVSAQQGRILSPKTAGIFLMRLTQKGHLVSATSGSTGRGRPAHLYTAALLRDDALQQVLLNFIGSYGIEPCDLVAIQAALAQRRAFMPKL